MDEGHRDRPLAHCGGDPFDIAGPDVADSEHSGQTRFQEMGSPRKWPMRGGQILLRQIGSRLDEPVGIERDAPVEPLCAGHGTGHEKDVSYVVGLRAAGLIVAPAHPFEMMTPFQGHDFGVGAEDDGRILFDAANQIARHALRQPARSHEHMHTRARLREEDGRLAC